MVLDAELVTLRVGPPLEFERCFASLYLLVEEDSAIEGRRQTDWAHRTWFSVHGRHASFTSKSVRRSFVDFVSVEMRVSWNQ